MDACMSLEDGGERYDRSFFVFEGAADASCPFGTEWYGESHELGLLVRKVGRMTGNWQGSDDGWRMVLVFQQRERRPLWVTQPYFPRTRMSRSVVFSSLVLAKVVAVFISVLLL
jgi:hypothetical protein